MRTRGLAVSWETPGESLLRHLPGSGTRCHLVHGLHCRHLGETSKINIPDGLAFKIFLQNNLLFKTKLLEVNEQTRGTFSVLGLR